MAGMRLKRTPRVAVSAYFLAGGVGLRASLGRHGIVVSQFLVALMLMDIEDPHQEQHADDAE